ERRDVVGRAADPGVVERRADAVALGRADDVQVVDVPAVVGRELDELAEPELSVALRGLPPQPVPLRDLREEQAERRRLELVEARVVADELEVALVARAVEAEQADPLAELLVGDRDQAAVAERAEVLRRVEGEGRGDAGRRDPLRSEGLRRVLDDRRAEPGELRELGRTAEGV